MRWRSGRLCWCYHANKIVTVMMMSEKTRSHFRFTSQVEQGDNCKFSSIGV